MKGKDKGGSKIKIEGKEKEGELINMSLNSENIIWFKFQKILIE